MINSEYLEKLNNFQKEAVLHTSGPLLIVAGAGSGKTKVLTSRIANIVEKNLAFPNEILAVTFTNKAAREMQNRIGLILKKKAVGLPWLGTFHSICAKILRKHAKAVNLTHNFTIIDQDDQQRLIKNICKSKNIDTDFHEDYMITNILFAIACSAESGADKESIKKGLVTFEVPKGRFTVLNGYNNSEIIDSSYNANPVSFKAAIDSLAARSHDDKWIIMGQMGELGEDSEEHHINVIKYAESKNVNKIFLISEHSGSIKNNVKMDITVFKSKEDLIKTILPMLKSNVSVLIKASRFMKFESIVKSLIE